jgi:hypothetical protein
MDSDDYEAFTAELAARAAGDPDVVGLVAVGSMAGRDYVADAWSDHDFFLITRSGEQERYRRNLGWLPRAEEIVLQFRETEHGLKVIYDDGHMLEFAVFDVGEIALAGVNRYRVLLDRGGVERATAHVQANPRTPHDEVYLFGMLVSAALVAGGRARRGEVLSAAFLVTWLLRHLTELLARTLPSPKASLLDEFDSFRRFERAYPELGAELASLARLDPADASVALLDVTARELREALPDLPWRALDVVRARLVA